MLKSCAKCLNLSKYDSLLCSKANKIIGISEEEERRVYSVSMSTCGSELGRQVPLTRFYSVAHKHLQPNRLYISIYKFVGGGAGRGGGGTDGPQTNIWGDTPPPPPRFSAENIASAA